MNRTTARHVDRRIPFRELRELAGKSQSEVAIALGTDQPGVSRIEARRNVELDTLAAYAWALGYEVDVRFTRKGFRAVSYRLTRSRHGAKRR